MKIERNIQSQKHVQKQRSATQTGEWGGRDGGMYSRPSACSLVGQMAGWGLRPKATGESGGFQAGEENGQVKIPMAAMWKMGRRAVTGWEPRLGQRMEFGEAESMGQGADGPCGKDTPVQGSGL